MKNILQFVRTLFMAGLLASGYGCAEETVRNYMDENAPAPVAVDRNSITVDNFAGRSVIRYTVPDDENLLYVKAVYESSPGTLREAKASMYVDTLVAEGFGVSGDQPVQLYSVGKNGKESTPVSITVSPLTPPVVDAFASLDIEAVFGGVKGVFDNPSEAALTAVLSADTARTGIMTVLRAFPIGNPKAIFTYQPLDSVETNFSVYLKDRWGNKSDILYKTLTPIFEEKIPNTAWSKYHLASDQDAAVESEARYGLQHLWDNIFANENDNIFAGLHNIPLPRTFTVRLGCTAIISRLRMHHRKNFEYTGKTPKKIELYGSPVDSPGDDLSGGDWILLGKFDSSKPSGTGATITESDKEYANMEGENFEIVPTEDLPSPYIPVKYIRFRVMEVYDGALASQIIIAELDLFGQVQKEE